MPAMVRADGIASTTTFTVGYYITPPCLMQGENVFDLDNEKQFNLVQ